VTASSTRPETCRKIFQRRFRSCHLCHSIPLEERERIATLVSMHSPSTPVIALADLPTRRFTSVISPSKATAKTARIPPHCAGYGGYQTPPLPSAAARSRRMRDCISWLYFYSCL